MIQTALSPFSSVRMRMASSTGRTKIFPSPIFPVLAELLAAWLDTGQRPPLLASFDANRFGDAEIPIEVGDYYAGYRKTLDGSSATMSR